MPSNICTEQERQKPKGKLYSIQRDGDHSCGVGEGEMEGGWHSSLQVKGTQSHSCRQQPTRHHSVGLIHSDCDMLACLWGKTSTVALSSSAHTLTPPPHNFPIPATSPFLLPTTAGSISGALMNRGWGLMLWISGDRCESLRAAELHAPLARPASCRALLATLSHVWVCSDVISVCTCMSEWAGGWSREVACGARSP